MSDKSLKDKAVQIKGKDYVLVADRITYFNESFKNGSIRTDLVSDWKSDYIVVKATVVPDTSKPEAYFNGYSQATVGDGMVNKNAALENAETSAVGRALGMMGIGVVESVASADEMKKATTQAPKPRFATFKQIELMVNKVKWGANLHDKDAIINYLDTVLGKSLDQVLMGEVDEALVKIDKAIREDKVAGKIEEAVPPENEQDVVIENIPTTDEEMNKLLDKVS
jgi:hypothetical protein